MTRIYEVETTAKDLKVGDMIATENGGIDKVAKVEKSGPSGVKVSYEEFDTGEEFSVRLHADQLVIVERMA